MVRVENSEEPIIKVPVLKVEGRGRGRPKGAKNKKRNEEAK